MSWSHIAGVPGILIGGIFFAMLLFGWLLVVADLFWLSFLRRRLVGATWLVCASAIGILVTIFAGQLLLYTAFAAIVILSPWLTVWLANLVAWIIATRRYRAAGPDDEAILADVSPADLPLGRLKFGGTKLRITVAKFFWAVRNYIYYHEETRIAVNYEPPPSSIGVE